jgi:hypothetical protein
MRRVLFATAALALAACGSTQASEQPSATTAAKPRLSFGQLFPLTVNGAGFRGRERVRVTLRGSRTATKTVVADRRGRFTARFTVRVPTCGSVLVRAVGAAGSRASRELPRPDCREP